MREPNHTMKPPLNRLIQDDWFPQISNFMIPLPPPCGRLLNQKFLQYWPNITLLGDHAVFEQEILRGLRGSYSFDVLLAYLFNSLLSILAIKNTSVVTDDQDVSAEKCFLQGWIMKLPNQITLNLTYQQLPM